MLVFNLTPTHGSMTKKGEKVKSKRNRRDLAAGRIGPAIEEEIGVERDIQEAVIALVDSSWHDWPGMRTKGVSGPLAWSAL